MEKYKTYNINLAAYISLISGQQARVIKEINNNDRAKNGLYYLEFDLTDDVRQIINQFMNNNSYCEIHDFMSEFSKIKKAINNLKNGKVEN